MSAIVKALSAALFAASTLLLAGTLSHAQSWPQRPVKLILPLGPVPASTSPPAWSVSGSRPNGASRW